jgi:polyhydroxyalkanoate synthesis repressor PhaR
VGSTCSKPRVLFSAAFYGLLIRRSVLRTIKKYPNRRLYDAEDSKYITLSRVAEFAKEGVQFKVVSSESLEDITRSVLLQIILDQEASDKAIFSSESLFELIGYYGNTVPSLFNEYLQGSLKSFSEGQQQLCDQFNADSMKAFEKMASENMEMWQSVQDNFINMSGFVLPAKDKK